MSRIISIAKKYYFSYAVTCNLQIQFEGWSEHFTDKKFLLIKETFSDIAVKSSRANSHDCLRIPQSTPIVSLVWGSNRARSSRLISWSNSNVPCYPTLSRSVQQTPDSTYPRTLPYVSRERDNKTLSLCRQHTEIKLCVIKTWAF